MANFGTAYLQIIPSLKGGVKGLENEINRSDVGGRTGKNAGNRFGSAMGDVLKTAGGFVLAKAAFAIGETVGGAFTLGLDRYMSIENAEAKLGALGHSAETVTEIMDNALASVKGTSFGMGEAADTAASLVAAGIAPGKELEGVLTTIANTAAVAGTGMDEMGAIFGKVAASGKVQGDVLAQLADRGVPALQWLADELGVTAEQVMEMASAGEIDFETFQRAMANGMAPDAAVQMGDTLQGSMDNAKAALGRFGAEIMERIGPKIKDALDRIIEGFDWLSTNVGPVIDTLSEGFDVFFQAISGNSEIGEFEGVLRTINDIGVNIRDVFDSLFGTADDSWSTAAQGLGAVKDAADPLRRGLESLRDGFKSLWDAAQPILEDIGEALREWWEDHGPQVKRTVEELKDAIGSWMEYTGEAMQKAGEIIKWFWDLFGDDAANELKSSLSVILGIIETTVKVISGHFKVLGGLLTGDWAKVSEGMRDITGGMQTGMVTILDRLHDMTLGRFESMAGGIIQRGVKARDGALIALRSLRDQALGVATNARDWVIGKFVELAQGVRDAATNAKNWFGTAFDGIKAKAREPVEFVINTVYNKGIAAMWNKVANAFSLTTLPTHQFARGGWTGPGGRLDPAGIVHADEFVINKASRGQFESKFPGYLNHINMHGTLPGYAGGGQVAPVPGRGRRHSGYPWATWSGDFPVPMGTPIRSWKDGIVALVQHWAHSYGKHVRVNHDDGTSSLYAHMSRIMSFVGQRVLAGQTLGLVGSTGNSTGPHLHFETMGGPFTGGRAMSGSAQAGSIFPSLTDVFSGPLGKLSQLGDSPWEKLVGGVPRAIADELGDWAKSKLGFLNGGRVPFDGSHWLSEDGRPELVVGPQLRNMRSGSYVLNGDQTADLLGGGQTLVRVELVDERMRGLVRAEVRQMQREGLVLK